MTRKTLFLTTAIAATLLIAGWVWWHDVLLWWSAFTEFLLTVSRGAWTRVSVVVLLLTGKFFATSIGEFLASIFRRVSGRLARRGTLLLVALYTPVWIRNHFKGMSRLYDYLWQRLIVWFLRMRSHMPSGPLGYAIGFGLMILLFFGGTLLLGTYKLVIIFKFVPELIWKAAVWLWYYLLTWLFRFSMWRVVTRLFGMVWAVLVPEHYEEKFRKWRRGTLRRVIRRRNKIFPHYNRNYWRGKRRKTAAASASVREAAE